MLDTKELQDVVSRCRRFFNKTTDARKIADFVADMTDEGEITDKWLKSIGFTFPRGFHPSTLTLNGLETYLNPSRRWWYGGTPVNPAPKTRGDVVSLLFALSKGTP